MTAADKYADELYEMSRHITSTPESITLMRSRDELRRLAPMEAERDLLKRSYENSNAMWLASQARVKELEDALRGLLNKYTALVNCGDCGNWNPEEEKEVIAARKALGGTK